MKQTELQRILGERIEKLNRDDLAGDELVKEIERSKTITKLAKELVRSANLVINAKRSIGALDPDFVDSLV